MAANALPEIEARKLAGIEVWDMAMQAPAGTDKRNAFVSVLMSGGFALNQYARKMLGAPEAVRIMYDPERKRVGFIPANADDRSVYDVSGFGSGQITCSKLMEHYGISVSRTVRCYDLEMVDRVLVASLEGVLR